MDRLVRTAIFLFVAALLGVSTVFGQTDDPPELLVHYTFDAHPEGGADGEPVSEGALIRDVTGNGRDATVVGTGLNWEKDGRIGGAMNFDGSLSFLEDNDADRYLNGPDAMTVTVWVNSRVIVTDAGIINGDTPDDNDQNLSLRYDRDGKFGGGSTVVKGGVSTETGPMEYESGEGSQASIWQHLALVYESGEPLRLYVNGVRDEPTFEGTGGSGELKGQTTLRIGQGAKQDDDTWDGYIDDVRIYDGVLTDAQIAELAAGKEDVLPVELASFSVSADGPDARLTWQTASETNNAGFRVESRRVSEGAQASDWHRGGFVRGAGTTDQAQSYRFRLTGLTSGTHQVRLVQVDLDGTASPQPAKTVTIRPGTTSMMVAPNPVRSRASVVLQLPDAQRATVAVYNLLGQKVQVLHDGPLPAGREHRFAWDAARLPSGLYLVRTTTPRDALTTQVTVVQ